MYFVYLLRMETFLQGGKQKKRSEGNRRKRKSHGGGVPEFSHLDSGWHILSSIVSIVSSEFPLLPLFIQPYERGSDMKHCACEEKTSSTSKWWTRNLCGGLSLNEPLSRKQQILWRVAVLPATSLQDPLTLSLIIQDSFMAEKLKKLRLWIQIFRMKKNKIVVSIFFPFFSQAVTAQTTPVVAALLQARSCPCRTPHLRVTEQTRVTRPTRLRFPAIPQHQSDPWEVWRPLPWPWKNSGKYYVMATDGWWAYENIWNMKSCHLCRWCSPAEFADLSWKSHSKVSSIS